MTQIKAKTLLNKIVSINVFNFVLLKLQLKEQRGSESHSSVIPRKNKEIVLSDGRLHSHTWYLAINPTQLW